MNPYRRNTGNHDQSSPQDRNKFNKTMFEQSNSRPPENNSSVLNRGFNYGVKHFLAPEEGPIISVVMNFLQISETEVQHLHWIGALYHQDKRVSESHLIVKLNDYIRVHTLPRRFPKDNFDWSQRILTETSDYLVVNKPGGLPSHGSVDNLRENLLCYVEQFIKKPVFITSRLDVPTHGLMILAKNKEFVSHFNKSLQKNEVRKEYQALVSGNGPPLGQQVHYMEPSPRAPKKISDIETPHWLKCHLEILSTEYCSKKNQSRLSILLSTGRTHQIRAQLSFLGHPISGDIQYGSVMSGESQSIGLAATKIAFMNSIAEKVTFELGIEMLPF